MCGIVGYVGTRPAIPVVLNGLKALETRGYDSAGLITTNIRNETSLYKVVGKPERLSELVDRHFDFTSYIALGHTRWATHGGVTEANTHPHVVGGVAVVHNGIIENYAELKTHLKEVRGCSFVSDTDTEVIPHLINLHVKNGKKPLEAIRVVTSLLTGTFALGILFEGQQEVLYAVRKGPPLVIGFGDQGTSIASDQLAIASVADKVVHLKDGDIAEVTVSGAKIWDTNGNEVHRKLKPLNVDTTKADKGEYRHFLLKEIHDQPQAVQDTIRLLSNPETHEIIPPSGILFGFGGVDHLSIIACGTSYHAGLIARHWFGEYAGLPVHCETASEFRYGDTILSATEAGIVISQSGETADTIAALERIVKDGHRNIAIVNVPGSAMTEMAECTILTRAYPEISVASTKAFSAQLAVLACLAILAGSQRQKLPRHPGNRKYWDSVGTLNRLPSDMQMTIILEKQFEEIAKMIREATSVFFIGRGTNHPLALEGALKLKEISYIHAEGLPAGELKHGSLALIDKKIPTIAIAPYHGQEVLFEKTISNIVEIQSREGLVILLSDKEGCEKFGNRADFAVALPTVHPFVAPFVYAIALQLIAYHTAVLKGTDVDQPRNLAKSVVVE